MTAVVFQQGVCTEAGMYALRERRVHVTQEDFEMAVTKVRDAQIDLKHNKLSPKLIISYQYTVKSPAWIDPRDYLLSKACRGGYTGDIIYVGVLWLKY